MSSRSFRLETRSRARDEIKRIMQTVEKVRKWEKIWIETGLSNHLKVYKWVPVREEAKEDVGKVVKTQEVSNAQNSGQKTDTALPEIPSAMKLSASLETPQLSTGQLPPDLLLDSETAKPPAKAPTSRSAADENQKMADFEKRKERWSSAVAIDTEDNTDRPRSPH